MGIFDGDFKLLHCVKDDEVGLKMVIAVHDLTLGGDALGGIRFFPYLSEAEAIEDAKRLARGMTYKNAIVYQLSNGRLRHGGGKAVIWGDPKTQKTPELLTAAAKVINDLGGLYIGGEDMGMTPDDVEIMFKKTKYITGLKETHTHTERRGSGDPAPLTALGVFEGLRSCLWSVFGNYYMGNKVFAIQGIGSVGRAILNYLSDRGPRVIVTDISEDSLHTARQIYPAVQVLPPANSDEIFDQKADVFIPCARGGIINDNTVERLASAGVKIVAGCANNQLLEPRHGLELHKRGILYAPDYVINCGGVINVAIELDPLGYDLRRARDLVGAVGPFLARIFQDAKAKGIAPEQRADELAETVLRSVQTHLKLL